MFEAILNPSETLQFVTHLTNIFISSQGLRKFNKKLNRISFCLREAFINITESKQMQALFPL